MANRRELGVYDLRLYDLNIYDLRAQHLGIPDSGSSANGTVRTAKRPFRKNHPHTIKALPG